MWTWGWLDSSGYGGVPTAEYAGDVAQAQSTSRAGDGGGGGMASARASTTTYQDCFVPSTAPPKHKWPGRGADVQPPPPRVSVWNCTFNCAGRMPTRDNEEDILKGWIKPECSDLDDTAPDVIVFGLQELDTSPMSVVLPTLLTSSEMKEQAWRASCASCVPKGYKLVGSNFLVGMLIVVYVSPRVSPSVRNVKTETEKSTLFDAIKITEPSQKAWQTLECWDSI
eukprot:gene9432-682_t